MLASRDLNSELDIMENVKADSFTEIEKLQLKCSILTLRLLRDIRSNQVLDLKSRGVVLRETIPGKGQGAGDARTQAGK